MGLFRSCCAVGLEINDHEVKAAELRGSLKNLSLVKLERLGLPGGAVTEGSITRPEMVSRALEALWERGQFGSRRVILGLANQGVLVRFARFPKMERAKLDKVIRNHAQDFLPFPVDGVVLDYVVVGEIGGAAGPAQEVLLVAARREMIDSFLDALERAGMEAREIEVTSLALLRLLPETARRRPSALIDIGDGSSSIVVVAESRPRFARLITLGTSSGNGAGGEPPAIGESQVFVDQLIGEVRSSLGYYQAQPGNPPVEEIVLSGRGELLRGLADHIQKSFGVPVNIVRPLDGVMAPGELEKNRFASDFAACIALARRGLGG